MLRISGQAQKNLATVHSRALVRQGVNASNEKDGLTPSAAPPDT